MSRTRAGILCISLLAASAPAPAQVQPVAPACESDPGYRILDFWLGDWTVFVNGTRAGENHIRKILDGCAITEDWTDAGGGRGHSLFYYHPANRTWKQVWVTARAMERGGVKEKSLIGRTREGGLQFQGEIKVDGGGSYLDRTTLTPTAPDEVRQVIEISTDGGATWRTTFDGRYVR